jgi:hypothetical protein
MKGIRMKNINKIGKWILIAPLLTTVTTGCMNKAKESKASKKTFKVNESMVQAMMAGPHADIASGLTVFFIPDTQESDLEITTATAAQLANRRKVAKTIVVNSDKISIHTTKAKTAGAYLQNPATQCVNLLTAYVGMDICKKGAAEMEAGFKQVAAGLEQVHFDYLGIKEEKAKLTEQKEQVNAQIQTIQNGEDQSTLPALEEELQKIIHAIEVGLPAKEAVIAAKETELNKALKDLNEKKAKCDSLPGLWASLSDYHQNLPKCGEKKQVVDTNIAAATALGKEMVMAVGPTNWYTTDATKTSIIIKKNKVETISLAFAAPGLPTQEYSIENGSISDITYDSTFRELKFVIEEKDEHGFPNGNLIKVCLEKTAIDDVQKYTGSIKRKINGKIMMEGKMSIEFQN